MPLSLALRRIRGYSRRGPQGSLSGLICLTLGASAKLIVCTQHPSASARSLWLLVYASGIGGDLICRDWFVLFFGGFADFVMPFILLVH